MIFLAGLGVFLDAQLPCRVQCAVKHVLPGLCESNVGHAHASPAAGDGEKEFGHFFNEGGLLLYREYQVAIALFRRSQRREDSAVHAKVRLAHVRALFGAGQTQRNSAKVSYIHENLSVGFRVCLQMVKSSRASCGNYFTTSVFLRRV